jgi:hypothetical protein
MGFWDKLQSPDKGKPNPTERSRDHGKDGLSDRQKRDLDAINRSAKRKGKK